MVFNPNDHLIQIKNKGGAADYLPVQFRLVWFREQCPEGTIETEEVEIDLDRETEEEGYAWNNDTRRSEKIVKHARGYARFRAVVTDGKGGKATATKSETAASFPDYIEKSETGAVGRALAMLGFGTQFAPEFDEMPRIVDAPVDRPASTVHTPQGSVNPSVHTTHAATVQEGSNNALASEQQIASIRKLSQHLGKPEPESIEHLLYAEAKELITQLSAEYNEQRKQKAPVTNSINAPLASQLRKLFESIGSTLETAQKMTFGKVVASDNLTPEDCAQLKQVYDAWKARYDKKAS